MKNILIAFVMFLPALTFAQKKGRTESVKTKTGQIISVGDSVTLSNGQREDGTFKYVTRIGMTSPAGNSGDKFLANGRYFVYQVTNKGTIFIRRKNIHGVGNDKLQVWYDSALDVGELIIGTQK